MITYFTVTIQDQRPQDQREHAEHVLRVHRDRVVAEETLLHRVQRARPDVAVDDPQRPEDHRSTPQRPVPGTRVHVVPRAFLAHGVLRILRLFTFGRGAAKGSTERRRHRFTAQQVLRMVETGILDHGDGLSGAL